MKEQYTDFHFTLADDRELSLVTAPGTFKPTGTTKLLIDAVRQALSEPVTMLDLGCGSGVVGLALYLHGLVKSPLFASDLSEPAVHCTRLNLERYRCLSDVRRGSLFEPWSGLKFEAIVDDISGVAHEVAAVSPWFDGIPCESGRDGTDLVVKIMRQAAQHLTNDGKLFFPLISLSNVDIPLRAASEHFSTVERIARQEWPLPEQLMSHMPLLEQLQLDGCIRLHKRFGMVLFYTEIYCASNVKH